MNEVLTTALSMMLIGMTTVFIVLALVVGFGNLLIRTSNKLAPKQDSLISKKEIAIITSAVEEFTQNKGRITSIEKQ